MAVKFNVDKPFESIANFCNNSAFFNQKERNVFIEETRQYFGKRAYWDEDVIIPEDYKKRFSTDVATLLATSSLPRSERMRLLATIQKATNSHFNGLNEASQVYQLTNGKSWGWMSMGACRASGLKVPPLTSDTGIVSADGLTPSLRYTLDHIAHFLYREKKEGSIDVSIESLVELFNFAVEKKIDPIRDCLIEIFKSIGKIDHYKLSDHVVKYLDNPSFFNALLQINEQLSGSDSRRPSNFNAAVNRGQYGSKFDYGSKFTPSVTFDLPSAVAIPSFWWNEQKPFESIAQFTDRFSVLNSEEQRAAFATIRDFFFELAQSNKSVRPLNPERFSKVDLKFLLTLIPNKPFERHRFIAAVQKVTQLQFTALAEEDQVYPLEMRFTDTPQEISHGWLTRDFVKDSKWVMKQPTESGHMELEPIRLEQMNPLLALALQQLQYGSMTFNEGEFAGKIELAVELYQFAEKWNWRSLKRATIEWYQECGKKYEDKNALWDSAIASALHNPACFAFFKAQTRNRLSPDTSSLSEESLYQTLRFNFDDYEIRDVRSHRESVLRHVGKPNPKFLKALIRYSKGAREQAKPDIDNIICDLTSEYFGLSYRIAKYLLGNTDARDSELATTLDREGAKELSNLPKLLEQPHVGQFFAEINRTEQFESLALSVRQHVQTQQPACERLTEAFKAWSPSKTNDPLPDHFSPLLTELMKIVSARYQDKKSRVVQVLSPLSDCDNLFSSFVGADPARFEQAFCGWWDKKHQMSVADVRKLSTLLANKDLQAFLVENGVTTAELFRSFLDHQIAKIEVDLSLVALLNTVENKQTDEEQLKRIEGFIKEFKIITQVASLQNFTMLTRELQKCSLFQEAKGPELISFGGEAMNSQPNIDSIIKAYARRTLIETLIPNQTLRNFLSDRISSYAKPDKTERQKMEEFDREVKSLSYDAAQTILTIVSSEQAIKLFEENNLTAAREFLLRGLKVYMVTKPATGFLGLW